MEEEIICFYNVKDGKYYQSRYTHRWLNNLQNQVQKQKEVIDKTNKLLKEKVKVIPFDENGEGGGLELTDYDIQDLLDILKEVSE